MLEEEDLQQKIEREQKKKEEEDKIRQLEQILLDKMNKQKEKEFAKEKEEEDRKRKAAETEEKSQKKIEFERQQKQEKEISNRIKHQEELTRLDFERRQKEEDALLRQKKKREEEEKINQLEQMLESKINQQRKESEPGIQIDPTEKCKSNSFSYSKFESYKKDITTMDFNSNQSSIEISDRDSQQLGNEKYKEKNKAEITVSE